VSRRSGGRGRDGGGSRRRWARPTQREEHHPPTHLSEGDLRRHAAFRRARELVEVGRLRRARMALDGADFGIWEDADAALATLQRLHPMPCIPHPDCDLHDLMSPPARPPLTYLDGRDNLKRWVEYVLLVLGKAPRLWAPHVDGWRWNMSVP
jgi:hypothetical protein